MYVHTRMYSGIEFKTDQQQISSTFTADSNEKRITKMNETHFTHSHTHSRILMHTNSDTHTHARIAETVEDCAL